MLTLSQAAKLSGVSKATIHRHVKLGKLSAERLDDGSYRIDPAELARVHPRSAGTPETSHAVTNGTAGNPVETELRRMLAMLEEQLVDVRNDRDIWRGQAEALRLLTAPAPIVTPPPPASWWQRMRRW